MFLAADKGIAPPAPDDDPHSVVERIIARLEARPDFPGNTDAGAAGESGNEQPADEEADAETALAEEPADTDVDPDAETAPDGQPLHEVVINGRKERVTLDELRKGYSRQRDYSRKTAALAEQRRAIEAERAQLKEVLDAFIHHSEAIDPILAEGRTTDWARLAAEQPQLYARRRAAFDQRVARMQQAHAQRRRMAEQARAQHAQAMAGYADRQRHALLRRMPELADPAKRKELGDALSAYAASRGFAGDEQANIMDHRMLQVFHDALMYSRMRQARQAIQGKRVDGRSPTQAPRASRDGASMTSGRLSTLKRNALRSGRVDDVVASILAHLEEE